MYLAFHFNTNVSQSWCIQKTGGNTHTYIFIQFFIKIKAMTKDVHHICNRTSTLSRKEILAHILGPLKSHYIIFRYLKGSSQCKLYVFPLKWNDTLHNSSLVTTSFMYKCFEKRFHLQNPIHDCEKCLCLPRSCEVYHKAVICVLANYRLNLIKMSYCHVESNFCILKC